MSSAIIKAKHLFEGKFLYWYDGRGFGSPIPVPLAMDYHPIVLLSPLLSMRIIYSLLWILHLSAGVFFFLKLCRFIGLSNFFSRINGIFYAFSMPTIQYAITDDWAGGVLHWPMYSIVVYYTFKIATKVSPNILKDVIILSLICGFMMLNGVAGSLGLNYFIVLFFSTLFIILFIPDLKKIYAFIIVLLLTTLIISPVLYHTIIELARFPEELIRSTQNPFHLRQYFFSNLDPLNKSIIQSLINFDFINAFNQFFQESRFLRSRTPFIGFIYLILAFSGIQNFIKTLIKKNTRNLFNLFNSAVFLGFFLSFIFSISSPDLFFNFSHPWLYRDQMIFFGIITAGMQLQRLYNFQSLMIKKLSFGLVFLQLTQVLAYSHYFTFIGSGTTLNNGFKGSWNGKSINFFQGPKKGDKVFDWLLSNKKKYGKRIILSPLIQEDLSSEIPVLGSQNLYSIQDLNIHAGLEPINGYYNISMERIFPSVVSTKGHIWSNYDLLNNAMLLDIAGINWVLIKQSELEIEGPFEGLIKKDSISFKNSSAVFDDRTEFGHLSRVNEEWVLLFNPDAIERAFLLSPEIRKRKMEYRENCFHEMPRLYPDKYNSNTPKRFLCANFDDISKYRISGKVQTIGENGKMKMNIKQRKDPVILALSTLYRPEWEALSNDKKNLKIFPLFDAFIGIEIPKGVNSISINYNPRVRIFLHYLSFCTILFSIVLIIKNKNFLSKKLNYSTKDKD